MGIKMQVILLALIVILLYSFLIFCTTMPVVGILKAAVVYIFIKLFKRRK